MTKSLGLVTLVGVLGTLSYSDQLKAGVVMPSALMPPAPQSSLYGAEGGDEPKAMAAGGLWSGDDVRLYYVGSRSKKGEGGEGGEGSEGGESVEFRSNLSAAQETDEPASNGSGEARAKFAGDLSAVYVKVKIGNLVSDVTDAHLHCALAGQDGPVILPLSPSTGVRDGKIVKRRFSNSNLTTADCVPTCGFPVNNIASLHFAADQGCIYVNVHTVSFPDGEVRGQLLPKK